MVGIWLVRLPRRIELSTDLTWRIKYVQCCVPNFNDMRVFIIKRKGSTIWQNMYFDKEIIFSNGNKINTSKLFFRKKDAEAYLKALEYNEFYQIVGATVDSRY